MVGKIGCASLAALALVVGACESGDDSANPTEVATPTEEPTPTPVPPPPTGSPTSAATPVVTATPVTPRMSQSPSELLAALEDNRAKWDSAPIQNYRYDFTIACFCGFDGLPITMAVRNGELESMTNSFGKTLSEGFPFDNFYRYSTVARTFQQVATDIREARALAVTYDGGYGFPTTIWAGTRGVTDSGSFVTISNFEVIQ